MREVMSIHMGQAGVQMGSAVWELYAAEHGINSAGVPFETTEDDDLGTSHAFFTNTCKGNYVPRGVFVDLEPNTIDEIRGGSYSNLFHPDSLLNGMEDAANNFARGFFTVGNLISERLSDEIRRQIEICDCLSSIMVFKALGGGTGTGLCASMFDYLSEYSKVVKFEVPIYPAPTLSTCVVEAYNCILGEHFVMDDMDISFLIDNEALMEIYSRNIRASMITYHDLNRFVAQICSCVTAGARFESVVNNDIAAMQTNLVPFPRIHFPLINIAPIASCNRYNHEKNTTREITYEVFNKNNQIVKCDPSTSKYMACSLIYRGDVSPNEIFKTLNFIKNKKSIKFVDWVPTSFKVGLITRRVTQVPRSNMPLFNRNVTMLTNSAVIGQAIQKVVNRFHILYSKRAFIHWFVGEGLEEVEFSEALLNLANLVKDYEECSKDAVDGNAGEEEAAVEESAAVEEGEGEAAEEEAQDAAEEEANEVEEEGQAGEAEEAEEAEEVEEQENEQEMD